MKSGTPRSLLAFAALGTGAARNLLHGHDPRPLSQSPPYNQRKARAARRARYAAGVPRSIAFKRH